MFRYRLTAYYEEKKTETRVAQTVIVIADTDQEAVKMASAEVAKGAVGGRIRAIKVIEKGPVEAGVVFRGDPYIPFQWLGQLAAAAEGKPPGK